MAIQINGSALTPQPRDVVWDRVLVGNKLDGTQSVGSYRTLVLRSPTARGTSASFNWLNFENAVQSSIDVQAPGESGVSGSTVNYSSGVIVRAIKTISGEPGDVLTGVEMEVLVIV